MAKLCQGGVLAVALSGGIPGAHAAVAGCGMALSAPDVTAFAGQPSLADRNARRVNTPLYHDDPPLEMQVGNLTASPMPQPVTQPVATHAGFERVPAYRYDITRPTGHAWTAGF